MQRINILLIALMLSQAVAADQNDPLDSWGIAGLNSRAELEQIFELFPKAVKQQKPELLESYFPDFPFNVNCKENDGLGSTGRFSVQTKQGFIQTWNYLRESSPYFLDIQDSTPESASINYQGVGLGLGSVWVTPLIIDNQYTVRIYAINTQLLCSDLKARLGANSN